MKFMLVAVVLSAVLSSPFVRAGVQAPFETQWMPTPDQFVLMTDEQRTELISAMQDFYSKAGRRQPPRYGAEFQMQAPLHWMLFSSEVAEAYGVGQPCIIGGYISAFVKRKNGWVTCPVPDASQWPGYEKNNEYGCNPPKTMLCNPGVMGYPANKDGSGCTTVKSDLTEQCDSKAEKAQKVGVDLFEKYKNSDPKNPPLELVMFEKSALALQDHCKLGQGPTSPAESYNKNECRILRDRAAKILASIKAAREASIAAAAAAEKPVVTKCKIPAPSNWKEVEVTVLKGEYSVSAISNKDGEPARQVISKTKPTSVEMVGTAGKPDLSVTFKDGKFETCTLSEKAVAVAPPKPPHDPCAAGAGGDERWTEVCSFRDDRTVCQMDEKAKLDFGTNLRKTDSRMYGPNGFYPGKMDIRGMVEKGDVIMKFPDPASLAKSMKDDVIAESSTPEALAKINDFEKLSQQLIDSCQAETLKLADKEKKRIEKAKPIDSFRIVRLDNKINSVMYTCQRFNRDFKDGSKDPQKFLEFADGHAVIVHKGKERSGLIEVGRMNGQGDILESTMYKAGLRNPIGTRTLEGADNKAADKKSGDKKIQPITYKVSQDLNLCADTKVGKKRGAGAPNPFNKIYVAGSSYKICDSSDGKTYKAAAGLSVLSAGGPLRVKGNNPDTDEPMEYAITPNKEKKGTCDMSAEGLGIATSPAPAGGSGTVEVKGSGLIGK